MIVGPKLFILQHFANSELINVLIASILLQWDEMDFSDKLLGPFLTLSCYVGTTSFQMFLKCY